MRGARRVRVRTKTTCAPVLCILFQVGKVALWFQSIPKGPGRILLLVYTGFGLQHLGSILNPPLGLVVHEELWIGASAPLLIPVSSFAGCLQ